MGAHSILPPSSAATWVKCPGSVLMAMMYPEAEESAEAREGTAAHSVGEWLIQHGSRYGFDGLDRSAVVGTFANNGELITDEMYDSAEVYARDVVEVMREAGVFGGERCGLETRLEMPNIHPQLWGTCDAFVYHVQGGTLYVWDFKHGHEAVSAFENWQAVCYVAGLLHKLGIDGQGDQHLRVVIRVVQPRAYDREGPVKQWVTTAATLRGYFNQLRNAADEALGPDPRTLTGSHCKHCPGRHACEAARMAAGSAMEYAGKPTPEELPPAAVGVELQYLRRAAEAIKYRLTGLEEQALTLIKQGQRVPGWAAEPGYGRMVWGKPEDEVFALGELLGLDFRKPPVPITPKEAIKRGADEALVKAYAVRNQTSTKLVEDSVTQAKKVFSK